MPRKKADASKDANHVNKAEEIRQAAKTLGKRVRPRDIIAKLKGEKGIVVSSAQVSTTLHNAGFRRRRRRRAVATAGASATAGRRGAAHSAGKLSIESLLAAKSFIDRVGSIDKAEEAISALKKLR
jgi:hypothetical protein